MPARGITINALVIAVALQGFTLQACGDGTRMDTGEAPATPTGSPATTGLPAQGSPPSGNGEPPDPLPQTPVQEPSVPPPQTAPPNPTMAPEDAGAPAATASADALAALTDYLANDGASLQAIGEEGFATVPLTREDADAARAQLWDFLAEQIESSRAEEHAAKRIELDGVVLRYETAVLGSKPDDGWDLFISMHGGGSGPASVNDSQWRNQVSLASGYSPDNAIWVAPRAPTDDWNMWFKDHIDGLFDRLISNMIVFEGVNPNRVYLTGYSAGGDGVYGLAPRTADRWAGAGMSAGHPNGVSLANVRNLAFAIHVGGADTAFDRNLVGQEYIDKLAALQLGDPEGYPYQGMVHPGLPHWMNLADAVSIPFLQTHSRDMAADRVVWEQHEVVQARFYWLAVPPADATRGARVVASYDGQTITLEERAPAGPLRIRLRDDMLDLDAPVTVMSGNQVLFEGIAPRTIALLATTLAEREDPAGAYSAELEL